MLFTGGQSKARETKPNNWITTHSLSLSTTLDEGSGDGWTAKLHINVFYDSIATTPSTTHVH